MLNLAILVFKGIRVAISNDWGSYPYLCMLTFIISDF